MERRITLKQAINEAIDLEMARDERVIMIGEDIVGGFGADGEKDAWGGVLGATKGLYGKYGDRLLDAPLSEAAYVGAAIGAATCGMRPIAELIERSVQEAKAAPQPPVEALLADVYVSY